MYLTVDGMDRAKFACPRHLLEAKPYDGRTLEDLKKLGVYAKKLPATPLKHDAVRKGKVGRGKMTDRR